MPLPSACVNEFAPDDAVVGVTEVSIAAPVSKPLPPHAGKHDEQACES